MKDREFPCITPGCLRLLPVRLDFCNVHWSKLTAREKRECRRIAESCGITTRAEAVICDNVTNSKIVN